MQHNVAPLRTIEHNMALKPTHAARTLAAHDKAREAVQRHLRACAEPLSWVWQRCPRLCALVAAEQPPGTHLAVIALLALQRAGVCGPELARWQMLVALQKAAREAYVSPNGAQKCAIQSSLPKAPPDECHGRNDLRAAMRARFLAGAGEKSHRQRGSAAARRAGTFGSDQDTRTRSQAQPGQAPRRADQDAGRATRSPETSP